MKKYLTKIYIYTCFILIGICSCTVVAHAALDSASDTEFPYQTSKQTTTDVDQLVSKGVIGPDAYRKGKDSITEAVLDSGLVNQSEGAIEYIQRIFNWFLTMIAVLALIIDIYGFFSIFFAKDEEGIKNAKAIVKGTSMVIFLLGISWLIVSVMFWIINTARG